MKRSVQVFTLLLTSTFCVAALAQQEERKTFDPSKWREAIDQFKAQDAETPPPADAVLFIGSSTIRDWDTDALFAGQVTINRGFGGSTIQDAVHYMDEIVLPYRPRVIVFYSGDNDAARGQPARYIAEDFRQFAMRALAALPDTHIILLAIKPSVMRWEQWPVMAEANRLMAEVCAEDDRLTYLDLSDTLLNEEGQPDPEAFADGLHLSEAMYELWSDWVKQTLDGIDQDGGESSGE